MRIRRVISNNVISALDSQGNEVVAMGKGIGFHAKQGEKVPEEKIEKTFVLEEPEQMERLKDVLKNLPLEHIQISAEIIEYANSVYTRRLNESIYVTLTDHISFALQRYRDGLQFANPLLMEVKIFYPSEYLIGEYAVALINKKFQIDMTEDEAASIALHLVNAEYNTGISDTMRMTTLIKDSLQIVERFLGIKLDERSLYYSRFITHLKFTAQRLFAGQLLDSQDEDFTKIIFSIYPREYECAKKIADYIKAKYEKEVTREELAYLAVHIRRIQPDITD